MAGTPEHRENDALFHFSENPSIEVFTPSASGPIDFPAVWAIDRVHSPNYLLPRDCPRVTFYATTKTSSEDVFRFLMGNAQAHVVAIESAWHKRVRDAQLYQYVLPPDSFTLWDAGAGYYISREPVRPMRREPLRDLPEALLNLNVELRILPSLWRLHDAVASSTLQFSMIRMRNAAKREA